MAAQLEVHDKKISRHFAPGWFATAVHPGLAIDHTFTFDSARNWCVLYGGARFFGNEALNRVFTWSEGPGWIDRTVAGGPARTQHGAAFDPVRDRLVVFGGWMPSGTMLVPSNDTFLLNLAAGVWTQIPTPAALLPRYGCRLAFDAVNSTVVLFGGVVNGVPQNDVWELASGAATWVQTVTNGPAGPTQPAGRVFHAMEFLPTTGRCIVFGGTDNIVRLNDTWSYNAATNAFTPLPSATLPAVREEHAMAFHAGLGQLVMFGGAPGGLNDAWQLDPATGWTQTTLLPPSGISSDVRATFRHAMAYLPARDEILVCGGAPSMHTNVQLVALRTPGSLVPPMANERLVGRGVDDMCTMPQVYINSRPQIGTLATLQVMGLDAPLSCTPVVPQNIHMFYGFTTLPTPLTAGSQHIAGPGLFASGTPTAYANPTGLPVNVWSWETVIAIPNDPGFIGLRLFWQALVDPAGTAPFFTWSSSLETLIGS